MSKFSDYLQKKTIDPRRLLVASKKIEALQPKDRAIRLARRLRRKDTDSSDKQPKTDKPSHSGRPVTLPTLNNALQGKPVSGAVKTRILRATNAVLKQKNKGEAALKDLF